MINSKIKCTYNLLILNNGGSRELTIYTGVHIQGVTGGKDQTSGGCFLC